jgi:16S rRNA (guanine(527)-N(7))-methyltransferase RsmG
VQHSEILRIELERAGLQLSLGSSEQLVRYCGELSKWNRRMNLTGLAGNELVRRLVVEPAWIGSVLRMSGTVVDIGSGNGSPAIALAVSRAVTTHMVESRQRRAAFLRHVVATLKLRDVSVWVARFEEIAAQVGMAEWITLQGVRPSESLWKAMKLASKASTRVVWITSEAPTADPATPLDTIRSPFSSTEARVFALDQS